MPTRAASWARGEEAPGPAGQRRAPGTVLPGSAPGAYVVSRAPRSCGPSRGCASTPILLASGQRWPCGRRRSSGAAVRARRAAQVIAGQRPRVRAPGGSPMAFRQDTAWLASISGVSGTGASPAAPLADGYPGRRLQKSPPRLPTPAPVRPHLESRSSGGRRVPGEAGRPLVRRGPGRTPNRGSSRARSSTPQRGPRCPGPAVPFRLATAWLASVVGGWGQGSVEGGILLGDGYLGRRLAEGVFPLRGREWGRRCGGRSPSRAARASSARR